MRLACLLKLASRANSSSHNNSDRGCCRYSALKEPVVARALNAGKQTIEWLGFITRIAAVVRCHSVAAVARNATKRNESQQSRARMANTRAKIGGSLLIRRPSPSQCPIHRPAARSREQMFFAQHSPVARWSSNGRALAVRMVIIRLNLQPGPWLSLSLRAKPSFLAAYKRCNNNSRTLLLVGYRRRRDEQPLTDGLAHVFAISSQQSMNAAAAVVVVCCGQPLRS